MKTCGCCRISASADAAHCLNCGEGSWIVSAPVQETKPEDQKPKPEKGPGAKDPA